MTKDLKKSSNRTDISIFYSDVLAKNWCSQISYYVCVYSKRYNYLYCYTETKLNDINNNNNDNNNNDDKTKAYW